jgi:hypothetical protein
LVEIGLPTRDQQGKTCWEWTERFYVQEPSEAPDGHGSPTAYPPFDEEPVTEVELVLRSEEDEGKES